MQQFQSFAHAVGYLGLAKPLVAWAVRHVLGYRVSEQLMLWMLHHVTHMPAQLR